MLASLGPYEGHHLAAAALFLFVEGCFVYGVLHGLMNPVIGNNLQARRFNERVKYAASAINTLAAGMVAGAVVIPLVNEASLKGWSLIWGVAGLVLHVIGHLVLGLIKKEDGYE